MGRLFEWCRLVRPLLFWQTKNPQNAGDCRRMQTRSTVYSTSTTYRNTRVLVRPVGSDGEDPISADGDGPVSC